MVSVSVWPGVAPGGPLPIGEWEQSHHAIAARVAALTLKGAGVEGSDIVAYGEICRNVRRQCSDIERRRVVEKYLRV